MIACSECGRPAQFMTAKNRKRRARRDHDLCLRCFTKHVEKAKREDHAKRTEAAEAAHDRRIA
jgi:hypothetical protein